MVPENEVSEIPVWHPATIKVHEAITRYLLELGRELLLKIADPFLGEDWTEVATVNEIKVVSPTSLN